MDRRGSRGRREERTEGGKSRKPHGSAPFLDNRIRCIIRKPSESQEGMRRNRKREEQEAEEHVKA